MEKYKKFSYKMIKHVENAKRVKKQGSIHAAKQEMMEWNMHKPLPTFINGVANCQRACAGGEAKLYKGT